MNIFKESKINEETKKPENKNPDGIKFVDNPGTVSFKDKIKRNSGITIEDIQDFKKELQELDFSYFGKDMTKEEFIENSRRNMDLYKRMLDGERVYDTGSLKCIFPAVLKKMVATGNKNIYTIHLKLPGLTILTDEQAEILSECEKNVFLSNVASVTDKQAESLSRIQGKLYLNNLESLTDHQAKSFSRHNGGIILNGITSLTDKQAESLSTYQSELYLGGLTSVSKKQAEFLAKVRNLSVLPEIEAIINKYKKHD